MEKELIVVKGKVIEQEKGFTTEVGKAIGHKAADEMIKRNWDENPGDVMAQFMGRTIIEKILAQPGCIGIRTFYGMNELGIRQLVFVGVDKDGKNILEINSAQKETKEAGVIATRGALCPPICGGVIGPDWLDWVNNF